MAVLSRETRSMVGLSVPRPGHVAGMFLVGSSLGVLLVLGALIAFGQAYLGRIAPGVSIGGVEVGGLTRSQAALALESVLGTFDDGRIVVRSERGTAVITFRDVGRTVDYGPLIDRAAAIGRGGTRFEEAIAGIRSLLRPVAIPLQLGYDRTALAARLASFRDQSVRMPTNATVIRTKAGFELVPAIDGVTISTDRIEAALDTALLDTAAPRTFELSADPRSIAPATSDADARRAIAAADTITGDLVVAHGARTWTIPAARVRAWIAFGGSGATYAPTIRTTLIPNSLKAVARAVLRRPTEARFLRERGGRIFGVASSSDGRALDVDKTTARIGSALEKRAHGAPPASPVRVVTTTTVPELTTGEATRKAPLVTLLGTWTTYYGVSAHNGFSANITVPARKLDGVVVQPGAVFDFWRALGEVSFRTGYRLGGAIVGGHSVEGKALAGGICAASTTLFNAAARGGLEILTRSPHWYYITRYPLGLDATVSDSQTMRFRNDTDHPILIKSVAVPGMVRFEIWSLPNGRTTTWSRPSVSNVVRGYDTVQYTSTLPAGQRERTEWPVDGKDVVVIRTVRDAAGHVIHRDTFVSHYHRMVGITLVGR
jgi:vancomycin resistance protein YoaR